ncbi:MAG: dual specificity protein phosphatase family protein [Cyanobacteria bacterium J06555_3]
MSQPVSLPDYVWWLMPKKLAGMSRPPLSDLLQIYQAGIRGIVSVMDEPSGIDEYRAAGFQALWLPITGGQAPTLEQVKQFVQFAQPLIAQDHSVVVHCTSGNRRTGTLLAAYLVTQGTSPDQAIARIKAARPSAELRKAQADFIYQLAELN